MVTRRTEHSRMQRIEVLCMQSDISSSSKPQMECAILFFSRDILEGEFSRASQAFSTTVLWEWLARKGMQRFGENPLSQNEVFAKSKINAVSSTDDWSFTEHMSGDPRGQEMNTQTPIPCSAGIPNTCAIILSTGINLSPE